MSVNVTARVAYWKRLNHPMPRYVAFLRAINVGGHTVKMDHLRRLFEALDFDNVATFIASGNVVFETPDTDTDSLEETIETHLQAALGYPVATFLRSAPEVAAIAAYQPFPDADLDADSAALYIAFLPSAPNSAAQAQLLAARTPADDFHFRGRELYWLRRRRLSDAAYPGPPIEKILGLPATTRNVTTVRKLAAKYAADAAQEKP